MYTETTKDNMREDFRAWLDRHLAKPFPKDVVSICVNLDDDGGGCDLSGCSSFSNEDEEWSYDIICDFGTDEDCLLWDEPPGCREWDDEEREEAYNLRRRETQALIAGIVKEYCQNGMYADKLRALEGIGVGFCDGPVQIVYQKDRA